MIPPATYRKLCFDKRISHGAFRLWHCLKQHCNEADQAWPSQRTIADEIGCKTHSLAGWISELYAAGYLKSERVGQHHHFRYTLLEGDARAVLPIWCVPPRDAQKGDTPRCPKGRTVTPQRATRRDAQKGDESNIIGSIKKKRGGSGDPASAASPPLDQPSEDHREKCRALLYAGLVEVGLKKPKESF